MTLADYYFEQPALVLVPIEHLSPSGMSSTFASLVATHRGWDSGRIELFNTAFQLYWQRTAALAARTRYWPPPRLRHVGVILEPLAVRPYVQLLNTSAWSLYECDFDPAISTAEFAAYLLVHGDRMVLSGEVTTAALHTAAYWFDRTEHERAAFAAAAGRSPRPDAVAFQALAAATEWLRALYDDTVRPAPPGMPVRAIPGTGLQVPHAAQDRPPALVQQWTDVARNAVGAFHAAWQAPDRAAATALCDWLASDVPSLLVTGREGRIVWDPGTPTRLGALRRELRHATGAAVRDVIADLQVIDRHTHAFLASVADPTALPMPSASTEQRGYTYMHAGRRLIAYNLHEPHLERLQSPALPYARAMLGARTVHEWAHLAVDAGWVPQIAPPSEVAELTAALAGQLTGVIGSAPAPIHRKAAADLHGLGADAAGRELADILVRRMPDFQANLLARRSLSLSERETYIRHNIRTLRDQYTPEQLWRMLVRYLVEYQYLAFSAVADPRTFFLRSTWFDADFFATGVLGDARFDALTSTVARLCATYAVDERRFRAT